MVGGWSVHVAGNVPAQQVRLRLHAQHPCAPSPPCGLIHLHAHVPVIQPLPRSLLLAWRRQCAFGTCCRSFHVLCGRAAGQQLTFRATDGEPLAFCELHSRPAFEKMVSGAEDLGMEWEELKGRMLSQKIGHCRWGFCSKFASWRNEDACTAGDPTPSVSPLLHGLGLSCRWRSMWMASALWSCGGRQRVGMRATTAAVQRAAAERQLGGGRITLLHCIQPILCPSSYRCNRVILGHQVLQQPTPGGALPARLFANA